MKLKNTLTYLILCLSLITQAQNLVPNGEFETFSNCPSNTDQLNYATPWISYSNFAKSDYYNSCSTGTGISVPNVAYGYQMDFLGKTGFSGGFMLDKLAPNDDDRDYIIVKLNDTLQINNKYLASMYVSRAEAVDYAIGSIGMLFTDLSTFTSGTQTSIIANPQVKSNRIIYDTLNWILIYGKIVPGAVRISAATLVPCLGQRQRKQLLTMLRKPAGREYT
jgi:hypothetical protein